jgi:hypothetical protein
MIVTQVFWPDRVITLCPVESLAFELFPDRPWSTFEFEATDPYKHWIEDLLQEASDVVAIIVVQRPVEASSRNQPLKASEPALVMALACPLSQPIAEAVLHQGPARDHFQSRSSMEKIRDLQKNPLMSRLSEEVPSLVKTSLQQSLDDTPAQFSFRIHFDQTDATAHFQHEILTWRITKTEEEDRFPEIRIHLRPAGRWYGTGHLMQQHWPSCTACLELGPFYPFDNGVCGLGTLAIPGWCTTGGFSVLVDERRTPYLHLGMNAPRLGRQSPKKRAWSVGHENALREVLPLRDCRFPHPLSRGSSARSLVLGDDLLRIQSRCGYDYEPVWHPLWGTRLGFADQRVICMYVGVAAEANARSSRTALIRHMAGGAAPPPRPPPYPLLLKPIWTTWARFKQDVTEQDVLCFAKEIVDRNLPRSVLEIDDRWSSAYGDFCFDAEKFPQPHAMVKALHMHGFQVTLWCTAFIEERSEAYREGCSKGYLVAGGALFPWWQPQPVAALDVTNPDACRWFVDRARALMRKTGIDGFKFDSGEPCWLPRQQKAYPALAYPGQYTDWWLDRVVAPLTLPCDGVPSAAEMQLSAAVIHEASHIELAAGAISAVTLRQAMAVDSPCTFATDVGQQDTTPACMGTAVADENTMKTTTKDAKAMPIDLPSEVKTVTVFPAEARAATATCAAPDSRPAQSIPCLYRMFDRFSHEGIENGLASVIPTMLISGLLGFPFVLPDMVGGNEYDQVHADADLMQRWLYANALMPSMQLSLPPWTYGDAVEEALNEALAIREHLLGESGLLRALALEACNQGTPIARPMWWQEPTLPASWEIDDQFTVGDDLVVAPPLISSSLVTSSKSVAWSGSALSEGTFARQPVGRACAETAVPLVTQDAISTAKDERTLWLPPGLWFAYPSGAIRERRRPLHAPAPMTGPQTITAASVLPVYIRAGTPLARFVFVDAEEVFERFCSEHQGAVERIGTEKPTETRDR